MPTYSYKCSSCSKITEILCSYYEKKEKEADLRCENCNSGSLVPIFRVNLGSKEKENHCSGSCGGCSGCG